MSATPEISFRRLCQSELPMLTRWLAEPHVRRFYQKSLVSLEDVNLEYGPAIRGEEPSSCHLAFATVNLLRTCSVTAIATIRTGAGSSMWLTGSA